MPSHGADRYRPAVLLDNNFFWLGGEKKASFSRVYTLKIKLASVESNIISYLINLWENIFRKTYMLKTENATFSVK